MVGSIPRRIQARLSKMGWVSYKISDTSRNGYGTAIYLKDSISYRYGRWALKVSEEYSKYRELKNVVDTGENYIKRDVCNIVNYSCSLIT